MLCELKGASLLERALGTGCSLASVNEQAAGALPVLNRDAAPGVGPADERAPRSGISAHDRGSRREVPPLRRALRGNRVAMPTPLSTARSQRASQPRTGLARATLHRGSLLRPLSDPDRGEALLAGAGECLAPHHRSSHRRRAGMTRPRLLMIFLMTAPTRSPREPRKGGAAKTASAGIS